MTLQRDKQLKEGRDVATFAGRMRIALEQAGIFNVPELQARWKRAYKEELNRQTAHNWLHERANFAEYQNLYRICDITKTSARWLALGDGPATPARQISPEQAEVLDIYDRLKGDRLDRWVSAGRDALAAQEASPSAAKPFPHRR